MGGGGGGCITPGTWEPFIQTISQTLRLPSPPSTRRPWLPAWAQSRSSHKKGRALLPAKQLGAPGAALLSDAHTWSFRRAGTLPCRLRREARCLRLSHGASGPLSDSPLQSPEENTAATSPGSPGSGTFLCSICPSALCHFPVILIRGRLMHGLCFPVDRLHLAPPTPGLTGYADPYRRHQYPAPRPTLPR